MTGQYESGLEVSGWWWLPSEPERRVPGVLTFDQEHGGQLHLIGSLRDRSHAFEASEDGQALVMTEDSLNRSGEYGRIVGTAEQRAFTLEDCFRTHISNLFLNPEDATERIHVNRVLRGAQFEPEERLDATSITFELLHMIHWLTTGGFAERLHIGERVPEGEPLVSIDYHRPDVIELRFDDQSVSIEELLGLSGDRVSTRTVTRRCEVRIAGEMQPMDALLEVASDIQDLVSVGVGRTSTFERVCYSHPDIEREYGEQRVSLPIDLFVQWSAYETRRPEPISRHDMLFGLSDAGGPDFLLAWLAVSEKYRSSLRRVMATRYRTMVFSSDRLLNRAAALEAFDRERTGYASSKFRTRMSRPAVLAGEPFSELVGDTTIWIDRFKASRDTIANHGDRHPGALPASDHFLAEAAYYLFIICLLREADAPEALFERIVSNESFKFTGRRVRDALDGT